MGFEPMDSCVNDLIIPCPALAHQRKCIKHLSVQWTPLWSLLMHNSVTPAIYAGSQFNQNMFQRNPRKCKNVNS
jgi:hypothetical protein